MRRGCVATAPAGKARPSIKYIIAGNSLVDGLCEKCNAEQCRRLVELIPTSTISVRSQSSARPPKKSPFDRSLNLVKIRLSKCEISWQFIMEFLRAFTYIFRDRHWLIKVGGDCAFGRALPGASDWLALSLRSAGLSGGDHPQCQQRLSASAAGLGSHWRRCGQGGACPVGDRALPLATR